MLINSDAMTLHKTQIDVAFNRASDKAAKFFYVSYFQMKMRRNIFSYTKYGRSF